MHARKLDTRFRIERLERKHLALKERVVEMERQRFLSTTDQQLVHTLKKEKLATKDELEGLRRRGVMS